MITKKAMSRPAVVCAVVLVRLAGLGWLAAGLGQAAEARRKPAVPKPEAAAEVRVAKCPQQVEAEALCEDKPLAELIVLLGDERFHFRQAAEDKLHQLLHAAPGDKPNNVEAVCFGAYQTLPDPEIRMRARAVLADFATTLWSPECFLGVATAPDQGFDEDGNLVSRLKISKVTANGPAALAGIQAEDFLRGIDALQFADANAAKRFAAHLAARKPGDKVILHLEHEGNKSDVAVILGCKPRAQERDENGNSIALTPAQCLREYLAFKEGRSPNRPRP